MQSKLSADTANGEPDDRESDNIRIDDPTLSATELMIRLRDDDNHRALETLMRNFRRILYPYLNKYLGDSALAEDVFQDTWVCVYRRRKSFKDGYHFEPWVFTVARNAAIDAQRREKRHRGTVSLDKENADPFYTNVTLEKLLTSAELSPEERIAQKEEGEGVRGVMDKLTDQHNVIVQLVYFQGLKYQEAAEVLNVPLGTVKSRLHAAIDSLKKEYMRHAG